jgi:arsenite methyltransferase
VAGALAERDFVEKLQKIGFQDVEVVARAPFGIDECTLYPHFTDDLIALMQKLIPEDRHDSVATSIVVTARLAR